MRLIAVLVLAFTLTPVAPAQQPVPPAGMSRQQAVSKMLDDWHDAAAEADEERYFSHFTSDAVFMGTDVTERWTRDEFREWAKPYFKRGKAWSFTPHDRFISFSTDAKTAWFDELLDTPNLGTARGSGVAVFVGDGWRIAQYNLSVPVPNDLIDEVVEQIRRYHQRGQKGDAPRPGPAEDDRMQSARLRVMTFNIRFANPEDGPNSWDSRRAMVADLMRREEPDAAGLQEVLKSQLDDLGRDVPQLAHVGVGRDDGQTRGEYSPILYFRDRFNVDESGTFWFSATPEKPGSKSWGNTIPRICTWARLVEKSSGRAVYVYNVHLDHQSQASRDRSVQLLIDRISSRRHDDPVIITGDFNAGETSDAIRFVKGEWGRAEQGDSLPRFVDSFRIVYPSEQIVGTFNGFGQGASQEKIDYIFVPPGATVLDAEIVRDREGDRYPSDHFPVTAELGWLLGK
jgi:endonuclease/exonuclease/phosphatase family metal-dependent hydrolase